jgi:DNA-binding MarR family transcriptional regulator
VTALYEETLAESGLHATQYTALQLMKLAPNLTTTEIADALGLDQTTATRMLSLVRKGGLAVDARGADRRERLWKLTAAGEKTYQELRPAWEAAQAAFEKKLGRTEAVALKKASFLAASKLAAR